MRLIDTENFSKVMKDYFTDMITHHKYNVDCVDCNADLQHLLDEQPTTYDIDKVVEELEAKKETACGLLKIPDFLKKLYRNLRICVLMKQSKSSSRAVYQMMCASGNLIHI